MAIIAFVGVPGGPESLLIGRTWERECALASLRSSCGALLAGPQGVGKSALGRAVAEEFAGETGAEVVWLSATATDTPIPFAAFVPLAPDLATKPGRATDTLSLLQAFRAAIVRRTRGRPLLLVIDDVHRLDEPSAGLVLQLLDEGLARAVMTLDSGMTAPGAVLTMWKEELVGRIEVDALDRTSTEALVSELLAREARPAGMRNRAAMVGRTATHLVPSAGGDVADAVWRLGRGFPLYTRELVKEGCRAGRIVLRDGIWRLDGELQPGPRLSDLVAARIAPLTRAERDALELVALAEPFPLASMLRLLRPAQLERLERSGLLSLDLAEGDRIVSTGHPVIGGVLRQSVPISRAAGIGLRLADALDAEGRSESDLVRVVTWRLDGGADPGGELLVRASLLASTRHDWRAAARLAEAARSRRVGCEATLALADAYRALGRFTDALKVLGREEGEGDDQAARAAVLRASVLCFGFGRFPDALDVLTVAADRVEEPSDRAWILAMRAGLIGLAGRPTDAVEMAEKVLAEPGLRPTADLTARAVLSIGLSWTGRTERALEVLDDIGDAAEGMADLPTWCLTARMLGHELNGQLDALEEAARASYEQGLEHRDPRLLGPAAAALGRAALGRARLPRAVAWFREAAVALRAAGSLALRAPALIGLAEALALAGDVEGSTLALEEARRPAEHSDLLIPAWSVAAAWLSAAQGAVSEALERLSETAAEAHAAGHTVSEIRALHSAVRLGSSAPAERLIEMAGWVEGQLIHIVAEHATALAQTGRLGDSLDAVAERYAELGFTLYAAEAAAQASRAYASAGRSRKAAASAARGHFLFTSGQDDGPPPLGLALALSPPELTRREREVAMLAAGGMPSQAIASRLCLSVRTVETHLARVYVKLGIGGRSELSAALAAGPNWPHGVEAG